MTVISAPQQLHDAYIAWQNHVLDAVSVTGPAAEPNYPVSSMFNYFTFDGFKPVSAGVSNVDITMTAPVNCDYFAFYNTDLFENSGSILLQYFDGAVFVDCFTAIAPTDNSPQLILFPEVSSDQFRIVIDSPVTASIVSAVTFGQVLQIPNGLGLSFNSPQNSQQYKITSNQSETGNFIGRSVRKEASPFNIGTELLQYDWFVANWRPFLRHAERRPFFFKWSDSTYSDESVFCWTEETINDPQWIDQHFMSFELALRGLVS